MKQYLVKAKSKAIQRTAAAARGGGSACDQAGEKSTATGALRALKSLSAKDASSTQSAEAT